MTTREWRWHRLLHFYLRLIQIHDRILCLSVCKHENLFEMQFEMGWHQIK